MALGFTGVGQETAARQVLLDTIKKKYDAYLFNQKGDFNEPASTFLITQELMGASKEVETTECFSQELPFLEGALYVSAIITPAVAPGDPVEVELGGDYPASGILNFDYTDHLAIGVSRSDPYAVAGYISPGSTIDRTPFANTIVIQPSKLTTDFSPGGPNEMLVGTRISITGNSQPEFGDSHASHVVDYERYPVKWQTMRYSMAASGKSLVVSSWVNNLADGEDKQYLLDLMYMRYRAAWQMDGTLLEGQEIDPLSPGIGGMGTSLDGLVPTIISRGGILTNTPGFGPYTRAYLESMSEKIRAQGAPMNYVFYRGYGNLLSWNACLNDFPVGSVRYASEEYQPTKGFNINTMLDSVTITGGYKFSSQTLPRWDHPNLSGSPLIGNYYNAAVGMPVGSIRNPKTGSSDSHWSLLYLKGRKDFQWQWGGAAPSNKTGVDGRFWEVVQEFGVQFFGVNRFIFERNAL